MMALLHRWIRSLVHAPYFEPLSNISLASLFGLFFYRHVQALAHGITPFVLVLVLMEGLLVFFFITRHKARARSTDVIPLAYAILGTFIASALRPHGYTLSESVGSMLMLLGACLALAGYLSLNRSFGISPALRKVKTKGLYRFVRHPLYSSYLVLYVGYLCIFASALNVLVCAVMAFAFWKRAVFEEEVLAQSEEYREYQRRVPWRFIPGVI